MKYSGEVRLGWLSTVKKTPWEWRDFAEQLVEEYWWEAFLYRHQHLCIFWDGIHYCALQDLLVVYKHVSVFPYLLPLKEMYHVPQLHSFPGPSVSVLHSCSFPHQRKQNNKTKQNILLLCLSYLTIISSFIAVALGASACPSVTHTPK